MSASAYGTWTASARNGHGRQHHHVERRSSPGDDQQPFAISQQYLNDQYLTGMPDASSDLRPLSSSSSLTGAMGDANLTSSRQSHSPASSNSGHIYTGNTQNHDLSWTSSQMQTNMTIAMTNNSYPGVAGGGLGLFASGMPAAPGTGNIDMASLNDYPSTTRNVTPESLSPHSPQHYTQGYVASDAYGSSRNQMYAQQMTPYTSSPSSSSPSDRKDISEVQHLRRRVQELEQELNNAKSAMGSASGLPTPPHSAQFQSSWRTRTEARKRIYCSLNRAGNALCAWHDSRRERRAYPPRNAPAGYLNCGCTYEEALFEESLSRHGVGSYLPGETVRMDPALRNPLLKLLQERYGYKDGDFEHDPITEAWADGESPQIWEKKAQSGVMVKRRPDAERH